MQQKITTIIGSVLDLRIERIYLLRLQAKCSIRSAAGILDWISKLSRVCPMKNLSIVFSFALVFIAVPSMAQTIDGDWTVTEGEYAGAPVAKDALDAMSLKVTKNKFDAKSGDSLSKGSITSQSRSRPPQLVFKIDSGADAGREVNAIYELKGSILKIAFSQSAEFPEGFDSTTDNKLLVLTYKNNKPVAANRGGRKSRKFPALPEPEITSSGG